MSSISPGQPFVPIAPPNLKKSNSISESTLKAVCRFLEGTYQTEQQLTTTPATSLPSSLIRYASSTTLPTSATAYFGQLTSTPSDRFFKEPQLLLNEENRLVHDIERLALDHYLVFINSSRSISTLSIQSEEFSHRLDQLQNRVHELTSTLERIKSDGQILAERYKSFKKLELNQERLSEILSIGRLIDVCIRNHYYNETFKLLNFGFDVIEYLSDSVQPEQQTTSHLLSSLKKTMNAQRARLQRVLLKRLEESIDITTCLSIASLLRQMDRQARRSGDCLFPTGVEQEVLQRLSSSLNESKCKSEILFINDPIKAMMLGAESLRTHATEIGIKFVTLFDVEGEGPVDQYLFHWLLQQTSWFLSGLEKCLVPEYARETFCTSEMKGTCINDSIPLVLPIRNDISVVDSEDELKKTTTTTTTKDFTTINVIQRQDSEFTYQPPSKETLKSFALQLKLGRHSVGSDLSRVKLRCDFFPLASQCFEVFMNHYLRCSLENGRLEFKKQLDLYDWKPSSFSFSSPNSHMSMLIRHQPLAILTNSLIVICNELRLFPLLVFEETARRMFTEIFFAVMSLLEDIGKRFGFLDVEGRRIGCWDIARPDEVFPGERRIVSRARPQFFDEPSSSDPASIDHKWKNWNQRGCEYFLLCWCLLDDLVPLITDQLSSIFGQQTTRPLIDRDTLAKYVKWMLIPIHPSTEVLPSEPSPDIDILEPSIQYDNNTIEDTSNENAIY